MKVCTLASRFRIGATILLVLGACSAPEKAKPPAVAAPGALGASPAASEIVPREVQGEGSIAEVGGDASVEPADEELARARESFHEARAAKERGDHAAAQAKASEAIDLLLSGDETEDDAARVAILFDLGNFANDAGALQAAEKARRNVLEVRLRTLPEDHRDVQGPRLSLAETLYSLGDFAGARALGEEVLEALARTLPEDHPALQEMRVALALTMALLGDLSGARALQEQVLEVFARTLPEDHPDLQQARGNLAETLYSLGELSGARALQEKVLEVLARTLPADHSDLQRARGTLSATLYSLGDYAGARTLQQQVLEVFARTLPAEDPYLQWARGSLAATLSSLGDFTDARALQEQVLEVFTRTLPADHPDLQRARGSLAATLYSLGDLAGARALQEQVLEVRARTLPADHPDLQWAREKLALTLGSLDDFSGARPHQEQVLEVFSRTLPADHADLQRARGNLGRTLDLLGDPSGARRLHEQVLEVFSRTLPADHPNLQRARENLVGTLVALGDLSGARALLEQVVEIHSRTLPEDHPDLQWALENLAQMVKVGDPARARVLEERVLEACLRTHSADHPHVLQRRLSLAATLQRLGDHAGARVLQEQVREAFMRAPTEGHPDLQADRWMLAGTLKELGDLAGARSLQEQELEARLRALPEDHPIVQWARENLAQTLESLGDLAAVRALREQVLEARSRTLPADSPDLQTARGMLARTIVAQIARVRGGEGESDAETEEGRKRCEELLSDLCRTQSSASRAVLLSAPSREAEERCAQLAQKLDLGLSFALGSGVFDPIPALTRAAFELSETTRASGLVAARLARLARSDARYEKLSEGIRSAGEELARLAQSGGTREAFDVAVRKRDLAQRDLLKLASQSKDAAGLVVEPDPALISALIGEREAIVTYRRYRRLEFPQCCTQAHGTESLCAFVLRKEAELVLVDLGPSGPIESAVKEWRDLLGTPIERGTGVAATLDLTQRTRMQGAVLRRLVFDPLQAALGRAERVIVVLDDVLHSVPLDALPVEENAALAGASDQSGSLLGDRYRIEVQLCLNESGAASPNSAATLLALGGASFNSEPLALSAEESAALEVEQEKTPAVASLLRDGPWARGFEPLTYTGLEAREIAALFEEVHGGSQGVVRALVLEKRKASRVSIEELAPKARFLHLATHGWFAPESVRSWSDSDPLDEQGNSLIRTSAEERVKGASPMVLCGLALAGANLPADAIGRYPGLVTAEEISGWNLSSCELAVLSACDTNVGLRRAGQGVASLQKAMHMAGARSVITSLWKVPDEATKGLMLDFYRRIWVEKKPKSQALWEAKKRLREARDDRGQLLYSTRDWAAWVLTGDPK